MRVVLDTNVLMSGIFFGGYPGKVVDAWRRGKFRLVVSTAITNEYTRVARELASVYESVDIDRMLELIVREAEKINPVPLSEQVCSDRDDDMFIAAALGGSAEVIVSGDKALRKVSAFRGDRILSPSEFVRMLEDG